MPGGARVQPQGPSAWHIIGTGLNGLLPSSASFFSDFWTTPEAMAVPWEALGGVCSGTTPPARAFVPDAGSTYIRGWIPLHPGMGTLEP